MEDEKHRAKVCPECGANNDLGEPGCVNPAACLKTWLVKRAPGYELVRLCTIDEGQR